MEKEIAFLEKANFHPMLGVLFLSDVSLVVHVMALQSEQFYKCVAKMKAPGKLLSIKLEKLLTFNSLQTKAHRGRGEGVQRLRKGRGRSKKKDKENR